MCAGDVEGDTPRRRWFGDERLEVYNNDGVVSGSEKSGEHHRANLI